jgi:hypothetical protein
MFPAASLFIAALKRRARNVFCFSCGTRGAHGPRAHHAVLAILTSCAPSDRGCRRSAAAATTTAAAAAVGKPAAAAGAMSPDAASSPRDAPTTAAAAHPVAAAVRAPGAPSAGQPDSPRSGPAASGLPAAVHTDIARRCRSTLTPRPGPAHAAKAPLKAPTCAATTASASATPRARVPAGWGAPGAGSVGLNKLSPGRPRPVVSARIEVVPVVNGSLKAPVGLSRCTIVEDAPFPPPNTRVRYSRMAHVRHGDTSPCRTTSAASARVPHPTRSPIRWGLRRRELPQGLVFTRISRWRWRWRIAVPMADTHRTAPHRVTSLPPSLCSPGEGGMKPQLLVPVTPPCPHTHASAGAPEPATGSYGNAAPARHTLQAASSPPCSGSPPRVPPNPRGHSRPNRHHAPAPLTVLGCLGTKCAAPMYPCGMWPGRMHVHMHVHVRRWSWSCMRGP